MADRKRARVLAGAFVVGFIGIAAACSNQPAGTGGKGSGGGKSCSEQPCSLIPQCGCSSTEACTIDSMGGHYCAQLGTAHPGEDCSTHGCVAGSACIAVSNANGKLELCAAFCNTDSDCASGTTCSRHVSDGKGGTLPISLCSDACDPAANTGCTAPGTGCIFGHEATGAMRWYAQCSPPVGTAMLGATCSSANPCAPGLICGQSTTGSVCYAYCTLDGTHGCPSMQKCLAFPTPVKIGAVEYGACQ